MGKKQDGKVIDTWDVLVEGITYKVPVRYRKEFPETPFLVDYDLPNGENIRLTNSKIDQLQNSVSTALREKLSLKWERKILVSVEFSDNDINFNGRNCPRGDLRMQFEAIWEGTRSDGKRVYTEGNFQNEFRRNREYRERDWFIPKDEAGKTVSVIPDTPENRDSLNSILAHMKALYQRLSVVMNQDNVLKTLKSTESLFKELPHS